MFEIEISVSVWVEAPVCEGMATSAVGSLPLVVVSKSALLEHGLTVRTPLAVALRIVKGDHEVLFEGAAAALYVKVEHFIEVLQLVVKLAHIARA